MSALSRTIQGNTATIQGAYDGLATLKGAAARSRAARRDVGAALNEAMASLRQHKTWADAKESDDQVTAIEDAYALGESTGDHGNTYAALRAIRPTHPASAKVWRERMDAVAKATMTDAEFKLKKAEAHARHEKEIRDAKHVKALEDIARQGLDIRRQMERRLAGARGKNIDPNSPEGVAAYKEKHPEREPRPADVVTPEMAKAFGYPEGWVGQPRSSAEANASRMGINKPKTPPKQGKVVVPSVIEGAIKDAEEAAKASRDPLWHIGRRDRETGKWQPGTDPAELQAKLVAARKAKDDYVATHTKQAQADDLKGASEEDLLKIIQGDDEDQ